MSDDTLQVELVAADRLVWSGEATVVNARTAGGEIGILADHMPMLSLLEAGVVEVETADGETWVAAVDEGFLSVAGNRVSILASHAEMASDIDADQARSGARRGEGRRGRGPRTTPRSGDSRPASRPPRGRPDRHQALSHIRGPHRLPGRPSVVPGHLLVCAFYASGAAERGTGCRYGSGCWTRLVSCCS